MGRGWYVGASSEETPRQSSATEGGSVILEDAEKVGSPTLTHPCVFPGLRRGASSPSLG